MWAKYMLLVVCVGVVVSSASKYDEIKPSLIYQLPCMSFGGRCLVAGECPGGRKVGTGLCPLDEGRNCCQSVPKSTCRSGGGECVDFDCPSQLLFSKATDCKEGTHCCVMIN